MIAKIAWRNVWRNKIRSLVVIIAIAIGLWAGIFSSAFVVGMMNQKIDSVIKLEMSHFQFHHPRFQDELLAKFSIPKSNEVITQLEKEPHLIGLSPRVLSMSMLGSANKSGAIKVIGIDPQREALVTDIHTRILDGEYFEGVSRNPILISSKTAEEFKIKLRSKLVVTLNDINGEITSGAFRVVGIYNSQNPIYDKMNAFVRKSDLQRLMHLEGQIHEIAVLMDDHELAEPTALNYSNMFPESKVQAWMDLAIGMRFMVEAKDTYAVIIVSIILIALLFSIVNTMLMAVLERIREIGMLMAVGMSKMKVFWMIMLETVFLSLIGGPLGMLVAVIFIKYFGENGIDLGGAAYSDLGFASIVYPDLGLTSYIQIAVLVFAMAILAAIYPARKALKLNPVEAIRKL